MARRPSAAPAGWLGRSDRRGWGFALGLAALAGALRCHRLGASPLWLDEAVSYLFAREPLADLPRWLSLDSGPPLYYALLYAWMAVFGDAEAALRSLSAAAGTALVPAVYAVGRRLFGRRAALFAALVLAVLPVQVRYAQEARAYALLTFAGLLAMEGLRRWLDGGGPRWLAASAGGFLAALYLHNYGFLLLAGGAAYAAWEGWRRRAPLRALAPLPIVAVGYLPWIPVLARQLGNRAPTAWMGSVWAANGPLGSLLASLSSLSPAGRQPGYLGLPDPGWGPWPPLFAAALLAWGAVALARGRRNRASEGADPRRALAWLACYLLAPPLAGVVLSLVATPTYLPGRLDQVAVPAFCLLLGAGIDAARPAVLRVGLGVAVGLASLATLRAYHGAASEPGERELAAVVAARLVTGDAVVATSLTRAPLEYYLRHRPPGVELLSFPPEQALHPGHEDLSSLDPERLEAGAREILARLAPAGSAGRTVFVAFVPNRADAVLLERLRAHPGLRAVEDLGDYRQRLLGQPVKLFRLEVGAGRGDPAGE